MKKMFLSNKNFFQTCGHFQYNISWLCFDVSWCCSENYHKFEKNEDCTTVFLKWTDFTLLGFNKIPWFEFLTQVLWCLHMLQKWTRQKCVACHTTDIYFDGLLFRENKHFHAQIMWSFDAIRIMGGRSD